MSTEQDVDENLPTVTHTAKMEFLGYSLTVYQLDNGTRVIEDNAELRRMLADMSGEPEEKPC